MKKLKYNYEEKIVILKMRFKCNYLCLYPSYWKLEYKSVLPSAIHFEISNTIDIDNDDLLEYINLDSDYEKILLISGVKNDIFIHVNGKSKKLLHPEDKVNGIHIMKKEEYKDYINNKYINKNNDKYFDIEEYNIKEK
ncbi:MAG: hypothetical protein IJS58_04830 [Bacilli bacterium]|nr:hypothetical protein [Bacilli bacterium]